MAPIDPTNTARAFFSYEVADAIHTIQARCDGAMSDADVSTHFSTFVNAMSGLLYGSSFVKLERSALGSNVRVPADYTGDTEWGTGTGDPDEAPFFFSFTGKDTLGHKVRVELFGRGRAAGDNWRILASDDSAISDALDELRTSSAFWNTIDDVGAIWNSYANKSVAQHWVKQLRG
jgi:hypothetical protein